MLEKPGPTNHFSLLVPELARFCVDFFFLYAIYKFSFLHSFIHSFIPIVEPKYMAIVENPPNYHSSTTCLYRCYTYYSVAPSDVG